MLIDLPFGLLRQRLGSNFSSQLAGLPAQAQAQALWLWLVSVWVGQYRVVVHRRLSARTKQKTMTTMRERCGERRQLRQAIRASAASRAALWPPAPSGGNKTSSIVCPTMIHCFSTPTTTTKKTTTTEAPFSRLEARRNKPRPSSLVRFAPASSTQRAGWEGLRALACSAPLLDNASELYAHCINSADYGAVRDSLLARLALMQAPSLPEFGLQARLKC